MAFDGVDPSLAKSSPCLIHSTHPFIHPPYKHPFNSPTRSFTHLGICLSSHPSITCLPIHPPTHPPMYPSIYSSTYPYKHPSTHLLIHPSLHAFSYPSTQPPTHPPIHPCIYSMCPSLHPSSSHPSAHPPTIHLPMPPTILEKSARCQPLF